MYIVFLSFILKLNDMSFKLVLGLLPVLLATEARHLTSDVDSSRPLVYSIVESDDMKPLAQTKNLRPAAPSRSICGRHRRFLMIGAPPIIFGRAADVLLVCLTILLH